MVEHWRYTRVLKGQKKPYLHDWQNHPLTLDQIPMSDNIGLICGESSNGTLCIDFDGPSTIDFWQKNIDTEIPDTITWTSGREGRMQKAFSVDKEYWPFVRTIKRKTGVLGSDGKHELLEFRWNGNQSLLPPSIHPDTKKEYIFLGNTGTVNEIPEKALIYWLIECNKDLLTEDTAKAPIKYDNVNEMEVIRVLSIIKQNEPKLSYDDWMSVTFSVAHEVGVNKAIAMMSSVYPEQRKGEYRTLLQSYNRSRSPTFGSLKFRIKGK